MLIADATLEFLDSRHVRVAWSGTADWVAWIFRNGVLADGPRYFTEAARSVDLAATAPFCIEVHEAPKGETVAAISPPLTQKPTLWWSPRAGAARYIAYHKPTAAGAENVITQMAHDNRAHYEARVHNDLRADGGVWNFFRVEARSSRSVESVRSAWPHFVPGLPAIPTNLTAAGAAGVFTVTLEVA